VTISKQETGECLKPLMAVIRELSQRSALVALIVSVIGLMLQH
jgi:hypothetical protein